MVGSTDDPSVKRVLQPVVGGLRGHVTVDVRIGHEEGICVPERQEEGLDDLTYAVLAELEVVGLDNR